MTKIINNPLFKGISGMLGKLIVFREIRGKIIVASRPKRPDKLTAHQEAAKTRFLCAVEYARKQLANEQLKAEYATGITQAKHSAWVVAITDYLVAPKVTAIEANQYKGVTGDKIMIKAHDDFKVVSVQVSITTKAGSLIEWGEAVQQDKESDEWHYTVTTANATLPGTRIKAKAMDKPSNSGEMELVLKHD